MTRRRPRSPAYYGLDETLHPGVRLLSMKLAHAMGRDREWNERDGMDLSEHGWLTGLLQDVATVRLDHQEITTRPPDDHKVEATNLRMLLVDVAAALGLHLSPGAPLGAFAALPAKVREALKGDDR